MKLSCLDSDCQKNIESFYDFQTHSCLNLLENKPQINADERRFVNLNIQHFSEVYQGNSLIKSPQRAQSSTILVTIYETAAASRYRTRMTRIARIFTDTFAVMRRTTCS